MPIIEEVDPLDRPLHVHRCEDELWYVLEGEHIVKVATASSMSVSARSCSGHAAFSILCGGVPRTGRFLEFFISGRVRRILSRTGRGGMYRLIDARGIRMGF
jgi:hypothetical protein